MMIFIAKICHVTQNDPGKKNSKERKKKWTRIRKRSSKFGGLLAKFQG